MTRIPIEQMDNDITKMNDHDLLITMHEQIKNVRMDIKEIKDGTSEKLSDHELRIQTLEKSVEGAALVKKIVYGAVGIILVTVLSAIIYLVVKG